MTAARRLAVDDATRARPTKPFPPVQAGPRHARHDPQPDFPARYVLIMAAVTIPLGLGLGWAAPDLLADGDQPRHERPADAVQLPPGVVVEPSPGGAAHGRFTARHDPAPAPGPHHQDRARHPRDSRHQSSRPPTASPGDKPPDTAAPEPSVSPSPEASATPSASTRSSRRTAAQAVLDALTGRRPR